jgi:hypothetical protein
MYKYRSVHKLLTPLFHCACVDPDDTRDSGTLPFCFGFLLLIILYGHKLFSFRGVDLVQLVRFLVVKLTHTCSNSRFDMNIVFMTNYSFNGR